MNRFLLISLLFAGSAVFAASTGTVVISGIAPSVLRYEGKVASHDRQNYEIELLTKSGKDVRLHYNNHMRAFLHGHAIPWLEIKLQDPLTVVESADRTFVAAKGSRTSEEISGIVESLDRTIHTVDLRTSLGNLEEILNTPEAHIYLRGREINYLDASPGDSITVRFTQ